MNQERGLAHFGMRFRLYATVLVVVALVALAEAWGLRNFKMVLELVPEDHRTEQVQLAIDETRTLSVFIIGGTLLLSAVVALGVTHFLIRPIRRLERGVRRFAEGDLHHRIEVQTGDEIERLADVFNDMAEAIQSKQAALEQAAVRDQLTDLHNRRHLLEVLEQEVARSERSGQPFALLIMDIDYFKFYNDRLGHLAGDEALQLCAKILRASCRRADTVARYGGEEFVAVLPGASRELAAEVGERIRQAVEGFTFAGEEEQPGGTITLSLGAAEFGSDGRTPDELLQAADLRLYRAKEGGRNRVVASG